MLTFSMVKCLFSLIFPLKSSTRKLRVELSKSLERLKRLAEGKVIPFPSKRSNYQGTARLDKENPTIFDNFFSLLNYHKVLKELYQRFAVFNPLLYNVSLLWAFFICSWQFSRDARLLRKSMTRMPIVVRLTCLNLKNIANCWCDRANGLSIPLSLRRTVNINSLSVCLGSYSGLNNRFPFNWLFWEQKE